MTFEDDLQFLHSAAWKCRELQAGDDGTWRAAPVLASVRYHENTIPRLHAFEKAIRKALPELSAFGKARASKAYDSLADTITKPSYSKRIRLAYGSTSMPQLDRIEQVFSEEPFSGGLVFSIYDPVDLEIRRRPGYVPCLIAGSFLLQEGRLAVNVFFRSQSIVEFGLWDLLFLRELQSEMAERFSTRYNGQEILCGSMNLLFGRIIIQRRLARRRTRTAAGNYRYVHLPRGSTFRKWIRVIGRFTTEYECGRWTL